MCYANELTSRRYCTAVTTVAVRMIFPVASVVYIQVALCPSTLQVGPPTLCPALARVRCNRLWSLGASFANTVGATFCGEAVRRSLGAMSCGGHVPPATPCVPHSPMEQPPTCGTLLRSRRDDCRSSSCCSNSVPLCVCSSLAFSCITQAKSKASRLSSSKSFPQSIAQDASSSQSAVLAISCSTRGPHVVPGALENHTLFTPS
mmetsp:Transcript_7946/g.29395  ORF Transcript_7946/g.29395 Transcript_7946/m.29395 type:complete len:204 (-) Transcript_7946:1271-1882(-)